MFRRLTWLGVGLVVGAAGSKWVEIKARRRLARYIPAGSSALKAAPEVAGRALEVAAERVADLRNAVEGGRGCHGGPRERASAAAEAARARRADEGSMTSAAP